jgi:hypothetical protein
LPSKEGWEKNTRKVRVQGLLLVPALVRTLFSGVLQAA